MKRKMNKILCMLLVLTMVLTCFQIQPANAGTTYTKSKISSLIKQKQKELKTVQKKQNAEKKKFSQQTKGTVSIVFGDVRSTNPYVVYNSLSGSTYWITNSENMTTLFSKATGYIKPTGEYRTYNYTTCAVAKAVKVTAKPGKYDKRIQELKDKISQLKRALKSYVIIPDDSSTNTDIAVGETRTLSWYWSEPYTYKYTNATFTSSDPSILKILDKKKGKVKALKEGNVTITAKASLSGKTTKFKTHVRSQYAEITDCKFIIDSGRNTVTAVLSLDSDRVLQEGNPNFYIRDEESSGIASISSIETHSITKSQIDYIIHLDVKEEGTFSVVMETKSGESESITLRVNSFGNNLYISNDSSGEDYEEDDEDYDDNDIV